MRQVSWAHPRFGHLLATAGEPTGKKRRRETAGVSGSMVDQHGEAWIAAKFMKWTTSNTPLNYKQVEHGGWTGDS